MGVEGVMETQFLTDQLTLSQPGGGGLCPPYSQNCPPEFSDFPMTLFFQPRRGFGHSREVDERSGRRFWKLWENPRQSHYKEVLRWEIFIEQELKFGLDLGRFAILKPRVWDDYEQLLKVVFSHFQGQTNATILLKTL